MNAGKSSILTVETTVITCFANCQGSRGSKKDKAASAKPPPLEHVLRVSKQMVHARPYTAKVVATACELLLESFGPLANGAPPPCNAQIDPFMSQVDLCLSLVLSDGETPHSVLSLAYC